MAARHGFEPRLTGPEPVVLPLDERAARSDKYLIGVPDCKQES